MLKSLKPYIHRGEWGKALGIVGHKFDHVLNVRVLGRDEVVRTVHGCPMVLTFREPGISGELMTFREREILETRIVKDVVRPGMCILEVGANIGYYTILLGKLIGNTGRIIAFEPYPPNVAVLRKSLALNGLEDIVEVHEEAIGEVTRTEKLYIGKGSNLHTLVAQDAKAVNADSIDVTTRDVREVLLGAGRPVDFLRMDIEGYERQLLNRLAPDMGEALPGRILFEIHPIGTVDPDPSFTPPLENLLRLGYRIEAVISSSNPDARSRFAELGYEPAESYAIQDKWVHLYRNIRTDDLVRVAARRPKMTRAILVNRV